MPLRIGPITLMRSATHDAYRALAAAAWRMHREVWYGDPDDPDRQRKLMDADAVLSDALSRIPPEDDVVVHVPEDDA